mgnify:FL=1
MTRTTAVKSLARHVPDNMRAAGDLSAHWMACANWTIVEWTIGEMLGTIGAGANPRNWRLEHAVYRNRCLEFRLLDTSHTVGLELMQLECRATVDRATTDIRPLHATTLDIVCGQQWAWTYALIGLSLTLQPFGNWAVYHDLTYLVCWPRYAATSNNSTISPSPHKYFMESIRSLLRSLFPQEVNKNFPSLTSRRYPLD